MNYPKFIILLAVLFWALNAGAQDCSPLSPTSSGAGILAGLLGDDAEGIDGACQLASGADYYAVEVEYKGYDDEEHRLIGQLLDANHHEIPGCERVVVSLKNKPTSAKLNFAFDAAAKDFVVANVPVRYLKVIIVEGDDPLSDLNIGGISLTGTSAEYRVEHTFKTGKTEEGLSSSNVTVSVNLSPVGRARTIKQ